jgi:hypothetical protein
MDCVFGTDGQGPDRAFVFLPTPPSTTSHRPRRDGAAVLLRNHNVVHRDSICGIANSLVGKYLLNDDFGTFVARQIDAGWRSWSNHEWGVGAE